jgi:ABC-type sugar transport system permease subunit
MTAPAMEAQVPHAGGAVQQSWWSRVWQNHAPGYLFLLPWFVGFLGLTIGPIITSFYLSFTDFDLLTAPEWVGPANYVRMFTADPKFVASMQVTLTFVIFSVPLKLSNPRYSLWTLIVLSIWQFGSPMIIFLAGLRQIPQDMYEAASLDGASKWRQFWKITLPLLTPVVFFNAIIQTIEAFKSFTPAFIISAGTGNPINSTLFYTLYLYQEAFGFFRMGYASALAWFLLLLVACFTAFSFLTSKYWVHYDD